MSGMPKQKCALCGKDLDGKFTYLWAGQKICEKCYKAKKPGAFCAQCGREGPLYLWAGKRYCSACYRAVSEQGLCRMCMKPLDERTGTQLKVLTGYDGKNKVFALCGDCAATVKERNIRTEHALRTSPEYKLHYNARKVPPEPCGICGKMTLTDVMKTIGLPGRERKVCPKCADTFFTRDGKGYRHEFVPILFDGADVIPVTKAITARSLVENEPWSRDTVIPITEDTLTVRVIEGGETVREYEIGPGDDRPNKGQYLHLRAGIGHVNEPYVANVLTLSGYIAPAADEVPDPWMPQIRMEAYISGSGRDSFLASLYKGSPPEAKGLVYRGEPAPETKILVGWCPECRKSFTFTACPRRPAISHVMYSEDGDDLIFLTAFGKLPVEVVRYGLFKWNGKKYSVCYPFRCPRCGAPYVDHTERGLLGGREMAGCLLPGHTPGMVDLRQEGQRFEFNKEDGVIQIGPEEEDFQY